MQRLLAILVLTLNLAVSVAGQGLVKPRFLFDYIPGNTNYGMVDIASCLDLKNPVDPNDIDAGRWVAIVVLQKQNRVPSCAQCYTHIDGANIVGVLPIIKDTLREPFLIHSTVFTNHGLSWFWSPSKPDFSLATDILTSSNYLAPLTYQVSSDTLTSFVSSDTPRFSFPLTAGEATPITLNTPSPTTAFQDASVTGDPLAINTTSPYTQGLSYALHPLPGTRFRGQFLTVPDTVEPLPAELDFNGSGVAYPLAAMLHPGSTLVATSNEIATNKTIEITNRTGQGLLLTSNLKDGTLRRRVDPFLSPTQQTLGQENYARVFWPAKQYYENAQFSSAGLVTNMQLCGVNYEVKEYGTVHPEIIAALKDAYATWKGSSTPVPDGALWVTKDNIPVTGANSAHFNTVSKYWTGRM